jgi:aspartyl-tRNA(Asn)/glutamyl-tRNA(Gln) amidotransferase subunit B
VARLHGDAKARPTGILRDVLSLLNESGTALRDFERRVRPADLAALLDMVRDGKLSHAAATRVLPLMVRTGDRAEAVAEREGLLQVSDDAQLRAWIDEVFAERPTEAGRFAAGERKLQGVLVGLVMKKSKGSADPKLVNRLLAERVEG